MIIKEEADFDDGWTLGRAVVQVCSAVALYFKVAIRNSLAFK